MISLCSYTGDLSSMKMESNYISCNYNRPERIGMHSIDSGVGKDCWFFQLFVTMSKESKQCISEEYSLSLYLSIMNMKSVGFHVESMMASCMLWRVT